VSVALIHDILTGLVELGASDLHLAQGRKPRARVHGQLEDMEFPELDGKRLAQCLKALVDRDRYQRFEEHGDLDFAYELEGVARFRCNYLSTHAGLAAVMRVVSDEVIPLETLNLPPLLQELTSRTSGLILVTGPTGSGKSTTLAALIDVINATQPRHIVLIEDPIEFVHHSKTGFITQREVGTHTESFAAALQGAVREDPDVILVGELRDLETVSLALTAAETGHLVFGTLHTRSAPETIDRIVDQYPADQQAHVRTMLASSLMAVITQQLVRKAHGSGRVPAFEILIANNAVRNLIRENKLFQITSVMQAARGEGMQTTDMALKDLVTRGDISRESAISVSGNPNLFDDEDNRRKPPRQNRHS